MNPNEDRMLMAIFFLVLGIVIGMWFELLITKTVHGV